MYFFLIAFSRHIRTCVTHVLQYMYTLNLVHIAVKLHVQVFGHSKIYLVFAYAAPLGGRKLHTLQLLAFDG